MDRAEQNQALRDLDSLVADIVKFDTDARRVLLRGRFSSGQKLRKRGELAEMEGTPEAHHHDPTGDDAVWAEKADRIGKTIESMASSLSKWHVMSQWILDLSSTDVAERAKRTVPDCLACGDACVGRVLSGFDEKCYKRWTRAGRPDRVAFIYETKSRQRQDVEAEDESA